MLDQLGANGVALKSAAMAYFAMSSIASVLVAVTQPDAATYLALFMAFTAVIMLSILLSETGNSLINPAEGLVLAHQPINGATYVAAKLTHLARIVLYLVPGLNLIPAFAGSFLKQARWWYPLFHLGAALAMGILVALLCCAIFGWLLRFVPAARLKAAAQLLSTLPMLAMIYLKSFREWAARSHVFGWLPSRPAARASLWLIPILFAAAVVVLGLRSLSADYLIRVSSLSRSGTTLGRAERRSWMGDLVARYFGGQAARAGFSLPRT